MKYFICVFDYFSCLFLTQDIQYVKTNGEIHLLILQIVPPIAKNRARRKSGPFKFLSINERIPLDNFITKSDFCYKMKKHYTTKDNLLDVCKKCAREKGINKFGMRDIAKASGLALGTLYNYFKDKETMMIETLVSIWKDFISSIPSTTSFSTYLRNIINVVDNIEEVYPDFIKNHPRRISDDMLQKARELMNAELTEVKDQIISVLKKDKEIRKDVFDEHLTHEQIATFTIKNILSARNREEKEILLKIVKCAIY